MVTNSAYMKVWVDIKLKRCRDSIEAKKKHLYFSTSNPGFESPQFRFLMMIINFGALMNKGAQIYAQVGLLRNGATC